MKAENAYRKVGTPLPDFETLKKEQGTLRELQSKTGRDTAAMYMYDGKKQNNLEENRKKLKQCYNAIQVAHKIWQGKHDIPYAVHKNSARNLAESRLERIKEKLSFLSSNMLPTVHAKIRLAYRFTSGRRRLPTAALPAPQVHDAPPDPCLSPPSLDALPWLPVAGLLIGLALLVYWLVVRRLGKSKPKARDSVRDLEDGLLRVRDDPCLRVD